MKTILVLSAHPDFAEGIRVSLNPEQFRVVHRIGFEEAEPMFAHGLINACILDLDLTGVQGVWILERIHRRGQQGPGIISTDIKQTPMEEGTYLQRVTHILAKTLPARLLVALF